MKYLLAIFILLFSNLSLAEKIELSIQANFIPSSAKVIIFNQDKTTSVDANFKKINSNVYLVDYETDKMQTGSYISAILISTSGEKSFSKVTPLVPNYKAIETLPICHNNINTTIAPGQLGLIERLIHIRENRKINRIEKISKIMSEELIQKLSKFEKSFGFHYEKELSVTLEPYELVKRLNNIHYTLKHYNSRN